MSKLDAVIGQLQGFSSYGHDLKFTYLHDNPEAEKWEAKCHFIPHSNYIETAPTLLQAATKLLEALPNLDDYGSENGSDVK